MSQSLETQPARSESANNHVNIITLPPPPNFNPASPIQHATTKRLDDESLGISCIGTPQLQNTSSLSRRATPEKSQTQPHQQQVGAVAKKQSRTGSPSNLIQIGKEAVEKSAKKRPVVSSNQQPSAAVVKRQSQGPFTLRVDSRAVKNQRVTSLPKSHHRQPQQQNPAAVVSTRPKLKPVTNVANQPQQPRTKTPPVTASPHQHQHQQYPPPFRVGASPTLTSFEELNKLKRRAKSPHELKQEVAAEHHQHQHHSKRYFDIPKSSSPTPREIVEQKKKEQQSKLQPPGSARAGGVTNDHHHQPKRTSSREKQQQQHHEAVYNRLYPDRLREQQEIYDDYHHQKQIQATMQRRQGRQVDPRFSKQQQTDDMYLVEEQGQEYDEELDHLYQHEREQQQQQQDDLGSPIFEDDEELLEVQEELIELQNLLNEQQTKLKEKLQKRILELRNMKVRKSTLQQPKIPVEQPPQQQSSSSPFNVYSQVSRAPQFHQPSTPAIPQQQTMIIKTPPPPASTTTSSGRRTNATTNGTNSSAVAVTTSRFIDSHQSGRQTDTYFYPLGLVQQKRHHHQDPHSKNPFLAYITSVGAQSSPQAQINNGKPGGGFRAGTPPTTHHDYSHVQSRLYETTASAAARQNPTIEASTNSARKMNQQRTRSAEDRQRGAAGVVAANMHYKRTASNPNRKEMQRERNLEEYKRASTTPPPPLSGPLVFADHVNNRISKIWEERRDQQQNQNISSNGISPKMQQHIDAVAAELGYIRQKQKEEEEQQQQNPKPNLVKRPFRAGQDRRVRTPPPVVKFTRRQQTANDDEQVVPQQKMVQSDEFIEPVKVAKRHYRFDENGSVTVKKPDITQPAAVVTTVIPPQPKTPGKPMTNSNSNKAFKDKYSKNENFFKNQTDAIVVLETFGDATSGNSNNNNRRTMRQKVVPLHHQNDDDDDAESTPQAPLELPRPSTPPMPRRTITNNNITTKNQQQQRFTQQQTPINIPNPSFATQLDVAPTPHWTDQSGVDNSKREIVNVAELVHSLSKPRNRSLTQQQQQEGDDDENNYSPVPHNPQPPVVPSPRPQKQQQQHQQQNVRSTSTVSSSGTDQSSLPSEQDVVNITDLITAAANDLGVPAAPFQQQKNPPPLPQKEEGASPLPQRKQKTENAAERNQQVPATTNQQNELVVFNPKKGAQLAPSAGEEEEIVNVNARDYLKSSENNSQKIDDDQDRNTEYERQEEAAKARRRQQQQQQENTTVDNDNNTNASPLNEQKLQQNKSIINDQAQPRTAASAAPVDRVTERVLFNYDDGVY